MELVLQYFWLFWGRGASGTFTTAGTTPVANTPYLITGITGNVYEPGGAIVPITALDNTFGSHNNMFEWEGNSYSNIVVYNGSQNGISFDTPSDRIHITGTYYSFYIEGQGYVPADFAHSDLYSPHYGGAHRNGQLSLFSNLVPVPQSVRESNQAEGVALVVPLFIGLRILKKRLARKSTSSKATETVS